MTRITVRNPGVEIKPKKNKGEFLSGQKLCVKLHIASQAASAGKQDGTSLPWVTAVVGSGCLQSLPQAYATPELLTRSVMEAFDDMTDLPAEPAGSESWRKIVESFTASLAESRCTPPDESTAVDPPVVSITPEATKLLLVAALLTRLAHAGRAAGPSALGRVADEVIDINGIRPLDDPFDVANTVIGPARQLLRSLATALRLASARGDDEDELFEAFSKVCDGVDKDLTSGTLSLNSVRILTEASWYGATRALRNYYGWTEVLVGLLVKGGGADHRRRRPPLPDLLQASGFIEQLFQEPTVRRREKLERSATTPRSIYGAVATTLREQAELIQRSLLNQSAAPDTAGGSTEVWPPVAVSMGFDLELEMHLLQIGQPFTLALPIHRIDRDLADTLWMAGDVDPARGDGSSGPWAEESPHLLRPTNWRFLRQLPVQRGSEVRPLIIRMAGAPLIDISGIDALTPQRKMSPMLGAKRDFNERNDTPGRPPTLHVCVPVDEYHAMRVGQTELGSSAPTTNAAARGLSNDGVPARLLRDRVELSSDSHGNRYWCLLGVPLSDPAVRQRFMSLMAMRSRWTPDNTQSPIDDDGAAGTTGVAINRQLDDDEAWFLSWMGFEVVRSPLGAFVDDLAHCVVHLDLEHRPFTSSCTVK